MASYNKFNYLSYILIKMQIDNFLKDNHLLNLTNFINLKSKKNISKNRNETRLKFFYQLIHYGIFLYIFLNIYQTSMIYLCNYLNFQQYLAIFHELFFIINFNILNNLNFHSSLYSINPRSLLNILKIFHKIAIVKNWTAISILNPQ